MKPSNTNPYVVRGLCGVSTPAASHPGQGLAVSNSAYWPELSHDSMRPIDRDTGRLAVFFLLRHIGCHVSSTAELQTWIFDIGVYHVNLLEEVEEAFVNTLQSPDNNIIMSVSGFDSETHLPMFREAAMGLLREMAGASSSAERQRYGIDATKYMQILHEIVNELNRNLSDADAINLEVFSEARYV